jgi:hypothetical protein
MTTDKKKTFGVVEGTLVYAKIAEPSTKYQSKDTEYTISVIVNEDTADAWDEEFKKQPAKKVKASEFETKYKLPLPDSLKGEKNVYEIKLKRDATKDGEDFYPENRPKVFVDYDNGDRVDITESRLIANGSYGKVSYRINSNDFGTFAKLANVLMDEEGFKEYVSTGGAAGSEFGDVKEVKKEAPRKEATQARAAKAAKEPEPDASDDDSDSAPF